MPLGQAEDLFTSMLFGVCLAVRRLLVFPELSKVSEQKQTPTEIVGVCLRLIPTAGLESSALLPSWPFGTRW